MIKDLLTEICKRGCSIEIRSAYPTDHLPKCLVKINDSIVDPVFYVDIEFKISSIIPTSTHLYFQRIITNYKQYFDLERISNCENVDEVANIIRDMEIETIEYKEEKFQANILQNIGERRQFKLGFKLVIGGNFYKKNMKSLDYATHYLYKNNKRNFFYFASSDDKIHKIKPSPHKLASYSQNLIPVMIQDLINHHILELLRGLNCNLEIPKEIKLLIVNMLMRLNCWNNLGIYINFCA